MYSFTAQIDEMRMTTRNVVKDMIVTRHPVLTCCAVRVCFLLAPGIAPDTPITESQRQSSIGRHQLDTEGILYLRDL